MRDIGLPSTSISDLDKIGLESLVIYDGLQSEIFEVHFLGKKHDRNLCWKYNANHDPIKAIGDYEQQTFAWIMRMVEEGRFVLLDGDPEEIQNQLYRKDVLTSLQNKWAPRPV